MESTFLSKKGDHFMNYELRQYSFGETIGKGFNLYFNNFIPIVLVSLLCQVPNVLFNRATNFIKDTSNFSFIDANYFVQMIGIFLASILVQCFLSAYIIHWVSKKFLENNPAGPDYHITSIFPYILPVIGLSFVIGFAIVFGFLAFIIPGIIIALGFSVATEVLIIEKRRIRESMTRSWILTKGRKGTVFLIVMLTMLIIVGMNQVTLLLLRLSHLNTELISYLEIAISAITNPIQSCIMIVVYFNLRIEKEGFNIEHLTDQFTRADSPESSVEI